MYGRAGPAQDLQLQVKMIDEQGQAMAFAVRRCRELYNAALGERKEAWKKCGMSVTEARAEHCK